MGEVSTIDFFPLAWVLHLARAISTFNIINAMNKRKYSMPKTFLIYIGTCMLYSYFTLQLSDKSQKVEYACLFLYFVLQLILLKVLSDSKLYVKLTSIVFSFLTMTLSSVLYYNISFAIDFSTSFENSIDAGVLLQISMFMIIFSFVVAFLISIIKNKFNKKLNHDIKYIYFYLFPLTHFLGLELVYALAQMFIKNDGAIPNTLSKLITVYYIICFVIDISILFAVDYIEKKETENEKYKQIITKNELDYQHFSQLKDEKERFRKIRHDMSNILTTASGFIEIEKPEKALEILQNANEEIHLSAYEQICSNETINTIYIIKQRQANIKGIKLKLKIKENAEIHISDYDICRVLNNLIDNQINAVENSENKVCKLTIICNKSEIIIKGSNFCQSKNNSKSKNDSNHGYGQKIIASIAKKYSGSYNTTIENDLFITHTILQNIET